MAMTTTEDVGNGIKKIGEYTMYAGVFGLFTMAVVGVFAIDIVFIAALQKQARENQTLNFMLTLYIWHCFSGSGGHPLVLLLVSPITTLIAIGLSVAYDVSFVGMYLAGGWAIAAGLVLAGYAMHQLGQWIASQKPAAAEVDLQGVNCRFFARNPECDAAQPSAPPEEQANTQTQPIYNQDGTTCEQPPVVVAYALKNPYLAFCGL